MTSTNKLSNLQGIVNGVFGDSLQKTSNELAIDMALFHGNRPIDSADLSTAELPLTITNKVVIFLHGLTNTESVWNFTSKETARPLDNYGNRFSEELSLTPLYLRYNSGLSTETNGRQFNALLEDLVKKYPITIDDIILVGYSMGGLLMRYAQSNALASWKHKLKACIYIGTPHEGAALERFGSFTSNAFGLFPQPHFNIWQERINLRSQGIKDLHSGLKNEDLPFMQDSQHFFISGGLFKQQQTLRDRFFGDSLVRRSSAVPSSAPKTSEYAHFDNLGHNTLAHSEPVYAQLKNWLEPLVSKSSTIKYKHATWSDCYVETNKSSVHENKDMRSRATLGAAKLGLEAIELTLDTVKTMHYSISDQVYQRIEHIPLAKTVREGHHFVFTGVYTNLRNGVSTLRRHMSKRHSQNKHDV